MKYRILLITCVGFFVSCSFMQNEPVIMPIKNSEVFILPFDKVWAGIVSVISEMSLPIQSIEKESGLITTQFILDNSNEWEPAKKMAYTPSVFLGTWTGCRYSYSFFVNKQSENQTNVRINTHIEGYESNVTKNWHVCPSRGILENNFFERLKLSLGVRPQEGTGNIPDESSMTKANKKILIKNRKGNYVLFVSNRDYNIGEKINVYRDWRKIGQIEVVKKQKGQIASKIILETGGEIQIGDEIK